MKFEDKNFIAQQIRLYRKRAGLTQEQLAEKVNLSTQHISRIEGACYTPSLNSFFMIANALNMDLEAFGYNINTSGNQRKNNLIQSIATASETELIFYENIVSAIDKSLEKIKKEIL